MAYIQDPESEPAIADVKRTAFIGVFITPELKELVKAEAKAQKRSVSQHLIFILENHCTTKDNDNASPKD
jgi:hypothetical protein